MPEWGWEGHLWEEAGCLWLCFSSNLSMVWFLNPKNGSKQNLWKQCQVVYQVHKLLIMAPGVAGVRGDPLEPIPLWRPWKARSWGQVLVRGLADSQRDGFSTRTGASPGCPPRRPTYFWFIHPPNAQLDPCQHLYLPAPSWMNSLPCRLHSLGPFQLCQPVCYSGALLRGTVTTLFPRGLGLLSPAWGWRLTITLVIIYSVPTVCHALCWELCGWSHSR